MLVKIMTLPFSSAFGGFNDAEVAEFLRDKDLISMREYLFTKDETPYLTLIIKYFPHRPELEQPHKAVASREEEWRSLLNEEQMGLFDLLREWRSKRCKKDGVPPYVIFNNKELAMIVRNRPQVLADFAKISGVGKKKIDSYGAEILEITKMNPSGEPFKLEPTDG